MAYFVILDSTANLVESFDNEAEGRAALEAIAQLDPDEAGEYALLVYDESGQPTGNALSGAAIGLHA